MRFNPITFCLLFLLLPGSTLHAQQEISVQKNLQYGRAPEGIKSKYYRFDLYRQEKQNTEPAPLLIMLHGGGFKLGNKRSNSTPTFCRAFAQQGWICASVNYRLSKGRPLTRYQDLVAGCYDALEDLQAAIDYFRQNSTKLGVDTSQIILAGNSAGAILALQYVYANRDSMAVLAGRKVEPNPGRQQAPSSIKAIINCWGAVFDSSWLKRNTVPIVSIHGIKDRVVPFEQNGKSLFGSGIIDRQCAVFGIPHVLKAYQDMGHELQRHFNPIFTGAAARKRYRETAAFAGSFLKTARIIN
jgi:predicted esterase